MEGALLTEEIPMRVSLRSIFCAALLAVSFAAVGARAVDVYAQIRGTVTDATGAAMAGVHLTATNVDTGVNYTATSGADGNYLFVQLPAPGTYDVKAEQTGFRRFAAEAIPLSLNQTYVQNVRMEVGTVTQQVTVEAAPLQVESTSIELGANITASEIVDMPLNGRNWIQLQQTLPGVVATTDSRGNFATNGSQPDQNSYLVNGIDSNDWPLNTPLVIPNPDAIAEVNLITNTINPEYGRNSGAIMNAVTKSGSNAFHGSGFEFYRDTSLDTRNFFSNGPGATSVIFHQNQFGGTIGGPIKKDKAFFFFSYQGTRNRVPQGTGTTTTTVFTNDQRNGIFTSIPNCASTGNTCASAFPLVGEDGKTYPAGTQYSTIFPTGHIPAADLDPLAVGLMNKFVPPATSGNNYVFNAVTAGKDDQFQPRIDYNLSSKDAIWGSWLWERHPTGDTLPFTGATLPGFPDTNERHIQNYSLTWNHTFNGSTLNEARFGYTRFNFGSVLPVNVLNPSSVGFTGIVPQDPTLSSYPVINLTGYFTLGFSTNGPQPRIDQTYQADDNFSKIVGRHAFKMGFDFRDFQVYNPFANQLSGNYAFGGTGAYSTGDPGADFLLGIPDTYGQGTGDIIDARGKEYYTYFQDQFKIRPNLTLTYGAGWQVDTPTIDIYHDGHAATAFRPGQTSTLYPNAPEGYVFQGDPGVNATGTTKYTHFGPRAGFAWSPGSSGKWSIRGGYGIYFNRELEEQTLQFLSSPPFGLATTGAAACGGSPGFANPFMDVASGALCNNPFPANPNPPSTVDFGQYEPLFLYAVDPNTAVPYSQNFNLTVERQLSPTLLVSAGYVGSLGRKEVTLRELNPGQNPAGCAADPSCVADRTFQGFDFPQNFPTYNPNIIAGIGNNQTTGTSNYNALQVTATKRLSHGLSFNAVYSWSKAMDDGSGFENSGFGGGGFGSYGSARATNPFNQAFYNYGPSGFDATSRFVITYTYDIPSIRHFDNGVAKRVFEGWRMSGITTFQTGFPLDVVDSGYRSLTCWAYTWTACWDVPNTLGSPQYVDPRTSNLVNATKGGTASNNHYWFDPNTFARAPIGVQGDAGRNLLRGPGISNWDWSLQKDTSITESTRLELRFEFYNLFNHTQFATGSGGTNFITTNINSANFGRILGAQNPRLIQLAAKIYF